MWVLIKANSIDPITCSQAREYINSPTSVNIFSEAKRDDILPVLLWLSHMRSWQSVTLVLTLEYESERFWDMIEGFQWVLSVIVEQLQRREWMRFELDYNLKGIGGFVSNLLLQKPLNYDFMSVHIQFNKLLCFFQSQWSLMSNDFSSAMNDFKIWYNMTVNYVFFHVYTIMLLWLFPWWL